MEKKDDRLIRYSSLACQFANDDGWSSSPVYMLAVKQANRYYMSMKDLHASMSAMKVDTENMMTAIVADTAKDGISQEQAAAIVANTSKRPLWGSAKLSRRGKSFQQ